MNKLIAGVYVAGFLLHNVIWVITIFALIVRSNNEDTMGQLGKDTDSDKTIPEER